MPDQTDQNSSTPLFDMSQAQPINDAASQQPQAAPLFDMSKAQPVQSQPAQQTPKDTGVWAGVKRNTVGAIEGVYHALSDPVTPEESAQLLQKIREHNERFEVKQGVMPAIPEESAQNPSKASLAYHRILDLPAESLLKKGKDETEAAKDLLHNHEYWKGGNLYLSGLADRALSAVPLVGPAINAIAERGEGSLVPMIDRQGNDVPIENVPENRKDFSGMMTDIAAGVVAEHAPKIVGGTARTIG